MNDETKPFTVTDRRHFTTEGETREEPPSPESREDAATEAGAGAGPKPSSEGQPEVTFAGFVAGLGAQATLLLGLGVGPGEETPTVDLGGARHVISILEMLKDKTEGHRSPEEDRILEGILYELRMVYVQKAQEGGR
jgi:hypothetical protein